MCQVILSVKSSCLSSHLVCQVILPVKSYCLSSHIVRHVLLSIKSYCTSSPVSSLLSSHIVNKVLCQVSFYWVKSCLPIGKVICQVMFVKFFVKYNICIVLYFYYSLILNLVRTIQRRSRIEDQGYPPQSPPPVVQQFFDRQSLGHSSAVLHCLAFPLHPNPQPV